MHGQNFALDSTKLIIPKQFFKTVGKQFLLNWTPLADKEKSGKNSNEPRLTLDSCQNYATASAACFLVTLIIGKTNQL